MWFKNLQLYVLTEQWQRSAEALHEQLLEKAFHPCGGLELQSSGWDSPLGRDSELLTHSANGCIMICMRREERLLPAAVVREVLEDKVADIESAEGRKVYRKEKMTLKDEITHTLLPQAFTRSNRMFAYIDPANGWVVIDSTSAKRAEEMLSLLRETLGSFKVVPMQVNLAPMSVLTEWLVKTAPRDFDVLDECDLRETVDEGGSLKCKRLDLTGDDIHQHLKSGMQVVKLSVQWREHIECVLCDDLSIKRLKFMDILQEEVENTGSEDAASRFDTEFALMNLILAQFIKSVLDAYGGMADEVVIAA